jgi:hypothetical protein
LEDGMVASVLAGISGCWLLINQPLKMYPTLFGAGAVINVVPEGSVDEAIAGNPEDKKIEARSKKTTRDRLRLTLITPP